MRAEHIRRDWTGHKEEVIRPEHEYCGVEIYSFDHQYTQKYHRGNTTFKGSNIANTTHRHLACIESKNNNDHFTIEVDYNCKVAGEYRIDIFYENKNRKDYKGQCEVTSPLPPANKYKAKAVPAEVNVTAINPNVIKKSTAFPSVATSKKFKLNFDGEKNCFKRNTIFMDLTQTGNHKLTIEIPVNCYFIGLTVRKLLLFVGDNMDSAGTNLQLTHCEVTQSNIISPAEANFTIGYSESFDNNLSRSGFYMDYMDEVNIYYRVNAEYDGKLYRRFGGYISSVELDDDRQTLEINCADRLQDGEDKFILDSLLILNGTSAKSEMEYYNPINFNSYGQTLKYLCDMFQDTLNSNISKNYLVQGEKYSTGLAIKYGKNKDIKKINTSHMTATINNKSVTLRNNASGKKKQTAIVYDGKALGKTKPVNITNHLTFHMTYGLGNTKSEKKQTIVEVIDDTPNAPGAQKWGKCGRSQDGKYVMAIGKISGVRKSGLKKGQLYKTVFVNKCPYCGTKTLVWDSGRKDSDCVHCGRYKRDISETELTCTKCCADFDAVTGYEKVKKPKKKVAKFTGSSKSTKAEQNKLHNGKMVAVPKSGIKVSEESVLKSVASIAKKYTYQLGASSSYSAMKKSGKGDCWAFSDLIATELKKYHIANRIYQYKTGYSKVHRSVVYLNSKNKWVSFPYKKYGLNSMLYSTSALKINKNYIVYNKGQNAGKVTAKSTNTKTQKTTVTTTNGYDKDKPFNAYIQIVYSTTQSWNAKTKVINLDFTQKAGTNNDLSGLTTVWINNAQRKTSVDMSLWFKDNERNKNIYLHSIKFITPKITTTNKNDNADWYTYDKSTHDNSSCKMDLYQIIFDNQKALNPTDLQSCGKTVIAMMEDVVKESGYLVHMIYEQHRCNDRIFFKIDNPTEVAFRATEGDDNNILEWTNISYTPASDLKNKSIFVFKSSSNKYEYVDTASIDSLLQYGEKATLKTSSEVMGSKQAYFNARNSEEYNPSQTYTYTIVVPYAPRVRLGDLVEVISNYRKLNDVKTVKSVKIIYDNSDMPRIRTEIGLDEIEPYLRIKKQQEKLRKQAKSSKKYFGRTATPVEDKEGDIYVWDN